MKQQQLVPKRSGYKLEMIKGFQIILSGKLDGLPDHAFYLVGNIDEVIVKIATSQVES